MNGESFSTDSLSGNGMQNNMYEAWRETQGFEDDDDTVSETISSNRDTSEGEKQNETGGNHQISAERATQYVTQYRAERKKHYDEKVNESRTFLRDYGYGDDEIDALFYRRDYETEAADENGNTAYKKDEDGNLVPFINKNKAEYGFEKLFNNGISVKDLHEANIVDIYSPDDIKGFASLFEDISDDYYYPRFCEKFQPMQSLNSIIQKRKQHEPLSEEDRDFAYACYPENINTYADSKTQPPRLDSGDNYLANRLLFGAGEYVLEEVERVDKDEPAKYFNRIIHLDEQINENKDAVYYFESRLPQLANDYRKASLELNNSIYRHLPLILSGINNLSHNAEIDHDLFKRYGELLLGSIATNHGSMPPETWKGQSVANPSGTGLGEAMLICGIDADTILDTYFGGDERYVKASFRPVSSDLEARRVSDMMRIGIPKEDIVSNIRRKNEDNNIGVFIGDAAIEEMRKAGLRNAEILDAMNPSVAYLERAKNSFEDQGFTKDDIMQYLMVKTDRLQSGLD